MAQTRREHSRSVDAFKLQSNVLFSFLYIFSLPHLFATNFAISSKNNSLFTFPTYFYFYFYLFLFPFSFMFLLLSLFFSFSFILPCVLINHDSNFNVWKTRQCIFFILFFFHFVLCIIFYFILQKIYVGICNFIIPISIKCSMCVHHTRLRLPLTLYTNSRRKYHNNNIQTLLTLSKKFFFLLNKRIIIFIYKYNHIVWKLNFHFLIIISNNFFFLFFSFISFPSHLFLFLYHNLHINYFNPLNILNFHWEFRRNESLYNWKLHAISWLSIHFQLYPKGLTNDIQTFLKRKYDVKTTWNIYTL